MHIKINLALIFLLLIASSVQAEDLLKPFILASKEPGGTITDKARTVKSALIGKGFTVAGSYAPYSEAIVIVVTDNELKAAAAKSERGGFGAIQRVAITKVTNEIQVSYTNPVYMAHAYRMADKLQGVADRLEAALGKLETFGAKGLTAAKLRKYHYMVGMEYFDEPSVLAEYASFEEAIKAVEAGLTTGHTDVTKVYRVDIPGKKETVFGVAMRSATEGNKYMDDKYIMSEIDFKGLKSTPHLPYEMLVSGNKVYALYARFRIAISFPNLSMMGSNSFMKIRSSPEAIRKALAKTAGAKEE